MARHLCIVARENSPLYGYLTIAFRDRPPGAPSIDIVLDRRHPDTDADGVNGGGPDRRRHSDVDAAVRTRGYAIFTGSGGGAPSGSDEAFIERAIGLLADVERRGPLALRFNARRRALVATVRRGLVTVLVLAVLIATVLRVGGIGRVVDEAAAWTDATVQRLEEAWVALRRDSARPQSPPARDAGGPTVASSPGPAAPAPPERTAPAPSVNPPLAAPARADSETARPTPRPPAAPEAARPAETPRAPRETVASADSRPLPAFTGLPRVAMSRQPSASDAGVVYSVRLTGPAGQPVPGAQIWLRGHTADGQTRETPLEDNQRPGVYSSGVLPPDLMPPRLSVRVYFRNMRLEIPVDH
jgi:hypothetical protein